MRLLVSPRPDYRAIDARILDLVDAGQVRAAGELLVESYGAELIGLCIHRAGDVTLGEDVAQDTLARALVGLPAYDGRAGLRIWLHRIAKNRCVDLQRRDQRALRRSVDEKELALLPAAERPMPSEHAEEQRARKQRLQAVRAALERLKEPDRSWVERRYAMGHTYDEIADEEGLSRAAVKQRVWRAVKQMRTLLAAEETKR